MGWLYMRHPETGGAQLVNDLPDVVQGFVERGWELYAMPPELDPDAPNTGGTEAVAVPVDTERMLSAGEVEGLRGQALEAALDAAGLPKSGTVAEKRARLKEHEAELAEPTDDEGVE